MTFLVPTLPSDEARIPCLDDAGRAAMRRLREHPDAPRWTYALGDRLLPADLDAIDAVRARLARARPQAATPSDRIMATLAGRVAQTPYLRALGAGALGDFEALPRTTRAQLAAAPWQFVPNDADLQRLIVYRTAGTTGHPVVVPHHPLAVAHYLPLVERALAAWGIAFTPEPGEPAALLLSAQLRTYTYATALMAWNGAGFAKLNLRQSDWPSAGASPRYLEAMDAPLVHGEPWTFAELLQQRPKIRPRWMMATSVAFEPGLQQALREAFGAVVVDWYATVETGPLAVSAPDGLGMILLADDVFLECVGPENRRLPIPCLEGTDDADAVIADLALGDLLVSGARNPYLPLLRYETGDRGRLIRAPDGTLRLVALQGRAAVRFDAADGTPVGTVDIARALREHPIGPRLLAHRFVQAADGTCALTLRPLPDRTLGTGELDAVRDAMAAIFAGGRVEVAVDPHLFDDDRAAGRKPVPYRNAAGERGSR